MTSVVTTAWVFEHFAPGWYMKDDGDVFLDARNHGGPDPRLADAPLDPVSHKDDGTPVYAPLRQRLIEHGEMCIVCPQCRQPSWNVSRHAAERHGVDVEVYTGPRRESAPDWWQPDWI